MKTRKLYEIREYRYANGVSVSMSPKLREFRRARRLAMRLRRMGHDAIIAPWAVRS